MNNVINKKSRALGLDLLKGIAAYAVVFIHSQGGAFGYPNPDSWGDRIISFFAGFAVPFFLAASFYLTIKKIYFSNRPYSFRSRLFSLLAPYLSWSAIYIFFRIFKYLVAGEITKINVLFSDLIPLAFFGGAAAQLYFLPLLITGIFWIQVNNKFLDKNKDNLRLILLLFCLSILIYQLLLTSGNDFSLGQNSAFGSLIKSSFPNLNNNPLVRLVLVETAWIIRCSPYILMAVILNNPRINKNFSWFNIKHIIIFFTLFFLLNASGDLESSIMPMSIHEILGAYCALLFGIALSNIMKDNQVITSLGVCSFGIYLIHHLIVEVLRPVIDKVFPISISIISIGICATVSFLLSWAVIFYIRKYKKIQYLLFGR